MISSQSHLAIRGARTTVILIGIVLFSAVSAPVADAQHFGRNKVQYQDFDFKVLETEHFDIYHYPQEAEAAKIAERWYARLSRVFDYEMGTRQPLILYASHPHFRQTNAISGGIGEGTGGVTESFKRRIVLPIGASLKDTDHVIGHELVHAFPVRHDRRGCSARFTPGHAIGAGPSVVVHRGDGRISLARTDRCADCDVDS